MCYNCCSLKGPWNSIVTSSSPLDCSLWAFRLRWHLFLLLSEGRAVSNLTYSYNWYIYSIFSFVLPFISSFKTFYLIFMVSVQSHIWVWHLCWNQTWEMGKGGGQQPFKGFARPTLLFPARGRLARVCVCDEWICLWNGEERMLESLQVLCWTITVLIIQILIVQSMWFVYFVCL